MSSAAAEPAAKRPKPIDSKTTAMTLPQPVWELILSFRGVEDIEWVIERVDHVYIREHVDMNGDVVVDEAVDRSKGAFRNKEDALERCILLNHAAFLSFRGDSNGYTQAMFDDRGHLDQILTDVYGEEPSIEARIFAMAFEPATLTPGMEREKSMLRTGETWLNPAPRDLNRPPIIMMHGLFKWALDDCGMEHVDFMCAENEWPGVRRGSVFLRWPDRRTRPVRVQQLEKLLHFQTTIIEAACDDRDDEQGEECYSTRLTFHQVKPLRRDTFGTGPLEVGLEF